MAVSWYRSPYTLKAIDSEMLSELLKDRTVPGLLNGVVSQVHRPPLMLVIEAAWKHFHIGGDVSFGPGDLFLTGDTFR